MFRSFSIWYAFIIFANLLFLSWHSEYLMVSKPLIMASLIGFYISAVPRQSTLFITAMIFALFGDIFLMFKNDIFFLLGLGSFLMMQILYTIKFLPDRSSELYMNTIKSLPYIILAVIILSVLWDTVGSMKIPVTIYTIAITVMVIAAVIRKKETRWYLPVIIGVTLFMFSDAAIAYNKFTSPFKGADYFIMSTYMLAQYLIVRGVIERELS